MSYDIVYHLACDWPDGCPETFRKSITDEGDAGITATGLGWILGTREVDWDLCPGHAGAYAARGETQVDMPALEDVPLEYVPDALAQELTARAGNGGIGVGSWLASRLRQRTRMEGRHAAARGRA